MTLFVASGERRAARRCAALLHAAGLLRPPLLSTQLIN
jgi:hypothetical protein